LSTFLNDLKWRFAAEEQMREVDRIIYANACLVDAVKRRWTSHVMMTYQGEIDKITWTAMEQWLKNDVSNPDTRALQAEQKLLLMTQKEGEKVNAFLDRWDAVACELPYRLDPLKEAIDLLIRMRGEIRERVLGGQLPQDRNALLNQARQIESHLDTSRGIGRTPATPQQPVYPPRHQAGDQRRGTSDPPVEAGATLPATSDRSRNLSGQCYTCGKTGHYSPTCPDSICRLCREKGHTAVSCPKNPATGSNTTPTVRRIEEARE
jgi:hypothetical protein